MTTSAKAIQLIRNSMNGQIKRCPPVFDIQEATRRLLAATDDINAEYTSGDINRFLDAVQLLGGLSARIIHDLDT